MLLKPALPSLLLAFLVYIAEARIDIHSEEHRGYNHHLKDQAPTDATFRHRYNAMLHSHNPMFGVMSKYFIRNRAQEHPGRKKRQIPPIPPSPPIQQLVQLSKLQEARNLKQKRNQQAYRQFSPTYTSNPSHPKIRQVRQPQQAQLYSKFPTYPRFLQTSYGQGQMAKNNRWSTGPPLSQFNYNGFYGKPQTLNNYYRKQGDYYKMYGKGKRPQYLQVYSPSHYNYINKRQDQIKPGVGQALGKKPQIKRKFRPILVQS